MPLTAPPPPAPPATPPLPEAPLDPPALDDEDPPLLPPDPDDEDAEPEPPSLGGGELGWGFLGGGWTVSSASSASTQA